MEIPLDQTILGPSVVRDMTVLGPLVQNCPSRIHLSGVRPLSPAVIEWFHIVLFVFITEEGYKASEKYRSQIN